MPFTLRSSVFDHDAEIPTEFTGEGRDVSPPLEWSDAPAGTKQFVLICDDPDAPQPTPWVHWVLYNIPSSVHSLPEGVPPHKRLTLGHGADSAVQGRNTFGKIGYGGPMPPVGHGLHHYFFKLYALDAELDLPPGMEKDDLLRAIEGHVLDEAQTVGTYVHEAAERRARKIA